MIAENVEAIIQDAGRYVEVKTALFKLKASDKAAETGSSIGAFVIMGVVFTVGVIVLSIGLSFWLGGKLGEVHYGFFIVAGFYLLLGLVLYLFRKSLLKTPLYNSIINKLAQ